MGNSRSAILQSAEDETEDLQANETALRSEVGFWREMIQARSDALPAEAVERMHHALALAEHRLVALYGRRHELANASHRSSGRPDRSSGRPARSLH